MACVTAAAEGCCCICCCCAACCSAGVEQLPLFVPGVLLADDEQFPATPGGEAVFTNLLDSLPDFHSCSDRSSPKTECYTITLNKAITIFTMNHVQSLPQRSGDGLNGVHYETEGPTADSGRCVPTKPTGEPC
jgi:hypothetical protein